MTADRQRDRERERQRETERHRQRETETETERVIQHVLPDVFMATGAFGHTHKLFFTCCYYIRI